MDTHNEMEAVLNADQEMLPVVDVDAEFAFKGVMHVDASLDTDLVGLTVPVGLVRDGNAIPAVWVQGSESGTDTSNDTLGKDMWL